MLLAVDELGSQASKCLRDIVALSTLPAVWAGSEPLRIAESLAGSLFTTLTAEFVFVALADGGSYVAIAQTDRHETSPLLADRLSPVVFDWVRTHDPEELLSLSSLSGSGLARLSARPVGHHAELGVVAAAFVRESGPTEFESLVLNVAATQAATAVQNSNLVRATRESAQRLLATVDHAPIGIIEAAPDATYINVNEAFCLLMGYSRDELVGRRIADVTHQEDVARDMALFAKLVSGEIPSYEIEKRFVRKDGEVVWARLRRSVVKDESGRVAYTIGSVEDVTDRVLTERALSHSRAQSEHQRRLYEAILTNTPDLAYVFDLEHRFVYANDVLLRLWGRTWDEAIGKTCSELGYEPWHAALHDREIDHVVATKAPVRGEVPFSGTFGARTYDYIFVPVLDADGEVIAVAGTTRDVTQYRQTEEERDHALAIAEMERSRLRDMLLVAPASICVLRGPEHTFELVNSRYLQLIGANDASQLIGKPIRAVLPDTQGQNYFEKLDQVFATGETFVGNEQPVSVDRSGTGRLDKIYVNFAFQPLRSTSGEVDGILVHAVEVTEQVKAREKIAASEERFRSLVSVVTDIPWTTDPYGTFVTPQEAWGEYTGQTWEEMSGFGWADALHPDDREPLLRMWTRAREGNKRYEAEGRLWCSSAGEYRYFVTRAAPIFDPDGSIREWVGSCTDVHERKLAEREILKLNEELEAKVAERTSELLAANEQLQGFTYSVAHDLRQQIRGINVNASMLLLDAQDFLDDENRDTLTRLVGSARRLGRLVDELLLYAKLGKQQPARCMIDLSQMAEEVAAYLREQGACPAGTRFVIGSGLCANGDPSMLRIVLENLLDNACKYRVAGRDPVIEVGRKDGAFFVRDNGIGFDMQYVGKLFQPFERLHRESEYSGTGIGLANVKRIVEKHGGRAWAEGVPDAGATFCFTLGDEAKPVF